MLRFRKFFFCNCLTCKTLTVTVTRKSKQYLNVLATLCALFSKAFINFSLKNPPKNYVKLQHDICKKISKHIMCLTYYKQRNLCLSDMYHSSQQILKARFRSTRPEVFYKKGVYRNFSKFTGKHLCQSLLFGLQLY